MTQEPSSTKGSRSILKQAVRYIIPLAITVLLVWYMFTKIDFAELWNTIRHGVDYKWILLAMAISVFSHVFRALRWRLQLRAMDITPPLMALCCSIFGTYALNLVFPRLGEVWRCTYIAQRQHTPVRLRLRFGAPARQFRQPRLLPRMTALLGRLRLS